jgi:hypothetical protein
MKGLSVAVLSLLFAAGSASGWEPWGLQDGAVATVLWDEIGETGVYAATLGDSAYVRHDGGQLWQRWNTGLGSDTLRALDWISPFGKGGCPYVLIYAATPNGVWCRWTEDPWMADSTWHPLSEGLADLDVTTVAAGYSPSAPYEYVVCGTQTGALYMRGFSDSTWQDISSPLFGSGPIVSISTDWYYIYAVSQGSGGDRLFRSSDCGASWEPLTVGETVVLIDANKWFGCDGIVWAGCEGGVMAVSSDWGVSWTFAQPFPSGSSCTATYQSSFGVGWAGASCGSIVRTPDYGLSWSPAGTVPAGVLDIVDYDGSAMLVGTSAGVYRGGVTPAEDPAQSERPMVALWPNPSPEGPTLDLHPCCTGPVRVAVYDLFGRRLLALDPVGPVAGAYSLPLDGSGRLDPGSYVCTVEVGGRTVTQRFIVTGP